jgi:hypothetical protein
MALIQHFQPSHQLAVVAAVTATQAQTHQEHQVVQAAVVAALTQAHLLAAQELLTKVMRVVLVAQLAQPLAAVVVVELAQ